MHVNVKSVAGWWIVALASVVSLAAVNDTRLIDAVKDSNVKRVQALVRERVDVNATAADGATALHWAVHKDDLDHCGFVDSRRRARECLRTIWASHRCTWLAQIAARLWSGDCCQPERIQTRHCCVVRPC